MIKVGVFILSFVLLIACKKTVNAVEIELYDLKTPSHFPKMPITADNPMTKEGVKLGKRLFYETLLSLDKSISCGSCHSAASAFSDPLKYSKGVNGTLGARNSMALVNLGYQKFFFWDGRANTLESQILEPVPNPIEMHLDWKEAMDRIKSDPSYRISFFNAFGKADFTEKEVAKALAQFLRTMISSSSKYDAMYKFENALPLTPAEQARLNSVSNDAWAGYDSFKSLSGADCFHCHNGALMQVQKFSNNGLDAAFSDVGRGAITGSANDNGKFKVPTLRNIALTAPYMHDGRFETLDEVIEHYSSGIHPSPTIDPLIEFAFQGGVQLSSEQKQQLKAFLLCLTDEEFISNPSFLP